jgi:cytochrome c551/c552
MSDEANAGESPRAVRAGSARQLLVWILLASGALAVFGGVLWWERAHAPATWSALPIGDPVEGSALFQSKGCVECHAVQGVGGVSAPDLGAIGSARSRPAHLVVAMWNHAPRMWDRMRSRSLDYPRLAGQEIADLFAYLYSAWCLEDGGDGSRGHALWETKGCAGCHPFEPSRAKGVDVAALAGVTSPVAWARAMWNHPLGTEVDRRSPFEGRDMHDLLAFTRGRRRVADTLLLTADPERGWKVFREKSCVACHSVKDETGRVGPALGSAYEVPETIVGLAGTLWNHAAAMAQAMKERGLPRPRFDDREMADLIAFLYSVRGSEPGGSPRAGEVLYEGRGCSRCHGAGARGTTTAPALRGNGGRFTSISFAAALWQHGPRMYERAKRSGLSWPDLAEGDVGDLITFLNTSAKGRP